MSPRLLLPGAALAFAVLGLAACADGERPALPGTPAAAGAPADDAARPLDPVHARLRGALGRYREIADAGGWPAVPAADSALRPGARSPVVPALRARLRLTGDLDARAAARRDSVYDPALAAAVARFQLRHGIDVDSLVGEETRAAMNVPAAERVRQIERVLARWEPLPDSMGRRHVVVNLPEFRLRAYEGGREALRMKVVVGDEVDDRGTPSFRDTMEHVVFRPYWNVPVGIAAEEIVPDARRSPGYLARNDYEIVGGAGDVHAPTAANLARVAAGDLRIRQRPGPENALGLVKFMFPNDHAIYLHDTPARHLFAQTDRAASHGCIRVERPLDLAAWALAGTPGWDRARVEQAMREGEDDRQVGLAEPIPVYLVYWPVYADEDGTVYFLRDVYGRFEA